MAILTLDDKKALGMYLGRCSCRTDENWYILYSYPSSDGRMRVYVCDRCGEQAETRCPVLNTGNKLPESHAKVQWVPEMKLHLMEQTTYKECPKQFDTHSQLESK